MAAAGKKGESRDEKEPLSVSIPAPMSPAKPALVQFIGTVNTLWGSDRILRSVQFLGRLIGGSPEVLPRPSLCAACRSLALGFSVCLLVCLRFSLVCGTRRLAASNLQVCNTGR